MEAQQTVVGERSVSDEDNWIPKCEEEKLNIDNKHVLQTPNVGNEKHDVNDGDPNPEPHEAEQDAKCDINGKFNQQCHEQEAATDRGEGGQLEGAQQTVVVGEKCDGLLGVSEDSHTPKHDVNGEQQTVVVGEKQ